MTNFQNIYHTLEKNEAKFDFLAQIIEEGYVFKKEDYQFTLGENEEVVFFFFDEYAFDDVENKPLEKELFTAFLKNAFANFDNQDTSKLDDLLAFASKIAYWDVFENYIEPLFLKELKELIAITYLDFLIENYTRFSSEKLLHFFKKNDHLTALVPQYLVKLGLYIVDYKNAKERLKDFIRCNKQEAILKKRLLNTFKYLHFPKQKKLHLFVDELYMELSVF